MNLMKKMFDLSLLELMKMLFSTIFKIIRDSIKLIFLSLSFILTILNIIAKRLMTVSLKSASSKDNVVSLKDFKRNEKN